MSGFVHRFPTNCQPLPGSPGLRTAPIPARPIAGLRTAIRLWRRRIGERQALAALSERELRDIGLSRSEIVTEASKPFWRA